VHLLADLADRPGILSRRWLSAVVLPYPAGAVIRMSETRSGVATRPCRAAIAPAAAAVPPHLVPAAQFAVTNHHCVATQPERRAGVSTFVAAR
jgi:hypothetical protein